MNQTQKDKKTVLSLGFGKAGSQLHLPNWIEAGYDVIAYTPGNRPIDPETLYCKAKAAYDSGRLTFIHSLTQLRISPTIVDIVTPSGTHIEAMQTFLQTVIANKLSPPLAWVIEKPIISSREELVQLRTLIETYELDQQGIFVNENYVASIALDHIRRVIARQEEAGNLLAAIDIVFYKDRVPDVRRGRFTDPTLGAYGIEMPHQLAAAYYLSDIHSITSANVIQNNYYKGIHGVPESEATYVHLQTDRGVDIKIAQGLGPFIMDAAGTITSKENPRITRTGVATFQDGTTAKIYFDPAPRTERFYSIVEWTENNKPHSLTLPDNTVARVFQAVIQYVKSGKREDFTEGLSVISAINYYTSLLTLRESAEMR